MIDWVDDDLKEWGRAVKGDVNLGHKRETIEHKMMMHGPGGLINDSKSRAADNVYFSDNVCKAERILLAMGRYDRALLTVAYTEMVSRDRQAKIFSDEIGYTVSRRQFMIDICKAHSWYSGYLIAKGEVVLKKSVDSCAQRSV